MKHEIKIDCRCESCGGTGLYVGMAERDGAAVVCHKCKGEGHYKDTITWHDFEKLAMKKGVKRVFPAACGICIGEGVIDGKKLVLEDFGGVSYDEWLINSPNRKKAFVKGTEMRNFTCPAWYYQTVDYEKKPSWDECCGIGSFSNCKYFPNKAACWKRYDKFGKKGE